MENREARVKWLRPLIYVLAAFALYRCWPARGVLWWALLCSAVLMAWSHATLSAEIKERRHVDLAVAVNPRLAAPKYGYGSTQAVRFWLRVNVVITAVVLALSIWTIVVSR
jgi:hypothetical protein